MSLAISVETEARIEAKAKEQGLSVDAYLNQLMDPPKGALSIGILEEAGLLPKSVADGEAPVLPAWDLGVRGSLRRRDIYDDVDSAPFSL